MSKTIKEINEAIKSLHPKEGQVSDGYHTFDELYDFRRAYNAALVNTHVYPCIKSHRHSDGELCFGGGWFIVQMNLPTGQISNHYEDKYWNEFDCKEQERAEPWDGHTEADVLARLTELNQNSYRMPLSQRLTDERGERVRKMYDNAMEVFCDTRDIEAKEYAIVSLILLKKYSARRCLKRMTDVLSTSTTLTCCFKTLGTWKTRFATYVVKCLQISFSLYNRAIRSMSAYSGFFCILLFSNFASVNDNQNLLCQIHRTSLARGTGSAARTSLP